MFLLVDLSHLLTLMQAAPAQATYTQFTSTQATPVQATTETNSSTLSKSHNVNDDDWEAQALKGIEKKNLSLDRGWGEKTWIQKSTCFERLKLLKDDGVDITSLKGPKLNNSAITKAILARVEARKQQASAQDVPQPAADDRMDTSVAEEGEGKGTITSTPDPMIVKEDKRSLGPIVRKHARDETLKVEVSFISHSTTEPRRKKACRSDLRANLPVEPTGEMQQEELIMDWEVLKRQVLTGIFAVNTSLYEDNSRITINFPSQSVKVAVSGTLELNSKGYDKIMEDLRVLSDGEDDDGNFELHGEHSSIRVITNVPLRTIIEGPFRAVMGLLERLREPGKRSRSYGEAVLQR
jgi:hypothetical protein